jgi:hypothetical protein
MSAVSETIMAMALAFKKRLELGNDAQARVAEYVAEYGWSTDGIGSIGNERVPASYAKNKAGELEHYTAPDLTIDKRNWPFSITLEVKNKNEYRGRYIIDAYRLDYITKWARMKDRFVLWVIEDESKGRSLFCASNDKLNSTPHRQYNPHTTNIEKTKTVPSWMFDASVFVPLEEALTAQLDSFHTTRSLYLPDQTGEVRQI